MADTAAREAAVAMTATSTQAFPLPQKEINVTSPAYHYDDQDLNLLKKMGATHLPEKKTIDL